MGDDDRPLPEVAVPSPSATLPQEPLDTRSHISHKELSECDREPLHHIGSIQGDAGHLLFFEYPSGRITAHDRDIRRVKWVRHRDVGVVNGVLDAPSSDGTSSLSSSQSSLTEDQEHIPLLGTYLHCWIPYSLYMIVTDMVEDMKMARSQRAFNFFNYRKRSYAISISTTMSDYSVVSMEVEELENEQEVRCVRGKR